MDLQTSLIDLDSIEQIEKNNFSIDPTEKSAEIEILAKTVISIKGLLRIPVVEQISIESYKLISGHFDYYAYLRARELDSSLPDRIRVFIVNPKKELAKGILEQLEAIERIDQKPTIVPGDSTGVILQQISNTINFEVLERLNKLEQKVNQNQETIENFSPQTHEIPIDTRFQETVDYLAAKIDNFENKVQATIANATSVVTQTPMSDPELGQSLISQLFTNLANGSVEVLIRKPQEVQQQIVQPIDPSMQVTPLEMLNNLSEIELINTLEKANLRKKREEIAKIAIKLIEARPFNSYKEIVDRKLGLTDTLLLRIIDSCSRLKK